MAASSSRSTAATDVANTSRPRRAAAAQQTTSLILCHICGLPATTGAGSTGRRTKAGDLPRVRKCPNNHVVRTLERVVGLSVDQLLVRLPLTKAEIIAEINRDKAHGRQGRYKQWKYELFDVTHLAGRLHIQLFGILERDECVAIAESLGAELAHRLVSPTGQVFHKRQESHPELESTPRMLGLLRRSQEPSKLRHFIVLEQIRDFILDELWAVGDGGDGLGGSARFRAAHAVYALSTHGRIASKPEEWPETKGLGPAVDHLVEPLNVEPNAQWASAAEFLTWLEGLHTRLGKTVRLKRHARPTDEWWRPVADPPTAPQHVVKRHKKLRKRGTSSPFVNPREDHGDLVLDRSFAEDDARQQSARDLEELEKQAVTLIANIKGIREQARGAQIESGAADAAIVPAQAGVPYEPFLIEKLGDAVAGAVSGRGFDDEGAENIIAWVLWSLIGQEVVLSSQLGAAVADCLRRLDDIAYLKWVIVAKELRVTSIQREAAGLLNYPSTRLIFTRPSVRSALPPAAPVDSRQLPR